MEWLGSLRLEHWQGSASGEAPALALNFCCEQDVRERQAGETPAALTCPGALGNAQPPNTAGWVRSQDLRCPQQEQMFIRVRVNSPQPTLILMVFGGARGRSVHCTV